MGDFWVNTPRNLWRFNFDSAANILNSLSLITIIITIIISLVLRSVKPFYICVIIIALFGLMYYLLTDKEAFGNGESLRLVDQAAQLQAQEAQLAQLQAQLQAQEAEMQLQAQIPARSAIRLENEPLRIPTPNNPFMNVEVGNYDAPQTKSGYVRYNAVPYESPYTGEIREKVENNFIGGLFQDPSGRLWDRQNSQREYVSQPVGGVPDKAVEFGMWLYGNTDGGLCKQGSIWDRYGLEHVENNCTFRNSSTPSNFGRKDMMQ